MRAQFRFRIRIIFLGILVIAFLIAGRLYYIQIVEGPTYALKAERQFSSPTQALFDRGSIYFTRKDGALISAATLRTGFLIAVNPKLVKDAHAAYKEIAATLAFPPKREDFLSAASRAERVYVEVAHRVPEQEGRTLAALDIPGIIVLRERWRDYPAGPLAAQTIGIVSYGAGASLAGQTGLESYYDYTLAREGDSLYRNFFATLFSSANDLLVDTKHVREGNIVTTIEPAVATRLHTELLAVHEKYKSKESGGIIMDPRTGAVFALQTLPTYDGNDLSRVNPSLLGNPLVEHVHEFGSIVKPLTIAAGLDAGVVTPESTYHDMGCTEVDTYTICNFDQKARGTVSLQRILSESLNLGALFVGRELGKERLRSYFTTLFGEKTNIDLPGETGSLLQNLSRREQVGYDTASFGQGIAVTPVQMISALSALANGGAMSRPHLARAVKLDTGVMRTLLAPETEEVFSPEAVREVAEILTHVVDYDLAQGAGKIPSMSVAAKTGTAQLTKQGGGYHKDRYFHSFFGYFPSHDPRFIILLYTNDPQGVRYASETLTTAFMNLTHFLINYYDVPPDRADTETSI